METPHDTPDAGWQPPSLESLGALLPQYEFLELLGVGGMGAVYRARQTALDRPVAVKVLPPSMEDADIDYAERFKIEALTMAKLSHPGIVGVHDFGQTADGQLYLVMEFIDGTDVFRLIAESGRLPAEQAVAIATQVCEALVYAHGHGIVHRDIKPANILITRSGQVKVADFGLARLGDQHDVSVSGEHVVLGTPDFVAPEALVIGATVDGRADVFAAGVMLYNMLTGKLPGKPFRTASLLLAGQIDPRLDEVIARAIQPDPALRYASAEEMRVELDRIAKNPGGVTSPAPRRQGAGGLVAGIVTAVAALAIGAIFLFSPKNPAGSGGEVAEVTPQPEPQPAPALGEMPVPPVEPVPPPQVAVSPPLPAEPLATAPLEPMAHGNGTRYQFVPGHFDRSAALAKADELGGRLARVESRDTLEWLWERIVEPGLAIGQRVWVDGETRDGSEWRWSDGSRAGDGLPWGREQPNEAVPGSYLDLYRDRDDRGLYDFQENERQWKGETVGLIVEYPAVAAPAPAMAAVPVIPDPAPTAMVAPSQPEPGPEPAKELTATEQRLAQLDSAFQVAYERDGGQAFTAAVAALDASYLAAIGRARVAAQGKGDLDEVTSLDAEKTLLESGAGLPPADLPGIPPGLLVLRQTYRATHARHIDERDRKTLPLYQRYLDTLAAYESELTRADQIEDAKFVRKTREGIAARMPGSETSEVAATTGPAPTTAPAPVPLTGSPWRQLSTWVIGHGGRVEVSKDGESRRIGSVEGLPNGKFDVTGVYLENGRAANITDSDFTLLATARNLRELNLSGASVTSLEAIRGLDQLSSVYLHDCKELDDGQLAHLGGLPALAEVHFYRLPIEGSCFTQLATCPKLTHLILNECAVTDEFLPLIGASRSLVELHLSDGSQCGDEGIRRLGETTSVQELSITGRQFTGAGWDTLATSGKLQTLRVSNANLTHEGLAAIARLSGLSRLVLDDVRIDAEALEPFASWSKLDSLTLTDGLASAFGLKAFAGCRELRSLDLGNTSALTDEAVALISVQFPRLEELQLGSGSYSSDSLATLANLRLLRALAVEQQRADDTWLPALERLTQVEELELEDWQMTGTALESLKSLKALRHLSLASCPQINDDAIPALKSLKRLGSLTVRNCALSNDGFRDLRRSLPDVSVDR